MIDANSNRAREGLRVCEDLVRFGLEQPGAFRRLRALRAALNAALIRLPLPAAERVRFRDSRRDLGRRVTPSGAESIEHLLLINLQRAKEALRVLEEAARVAAPGSIAAFQRLRFTLYDLERDILIRLAPVRDRGRRRRQGP